MKILIVGNMGYVGPVVTRHLRQKWPDCELVGLDSGLFAHCLSVPRLPETRLDRQIFCDLRDIAPEMLDGVDAVVNLAAVSNDPMGARFEDVTDEINWRAGARLAEMAAAGGVKRFVFASSCSMYGFAEGGPRAEHHDLNPLTAYARSKVATEKSLAQMAPNGMVTTALRFATACGFSERIRLDLVLNDFVASALATGRVTVLSDGTPWRPLIHVTDMARAIEWAITRDESETGSHLAVNVGTNSWNYQVRDLAEAVAAEIEGTDVSINTDAPPDKRSYQVDFSLYAKLAPEHQPRVTLPEAVADIAAGLSRLGFQDQDFRTSAFVRLNVLDQAIAQGSLNTDLRWT
ncbi:NAD-dependent epimerase [Agaricicola taiwanensis]|uniref:NAD-dependent epimerase n=1 Tax=Agaricicola taiwanensis TaxID=591372 RepID=A0A8J2VLR4_9RHOB|nr:SDR family oxidoreductase [Agaricicola taiwanensis]GGE32068.1 NAD-dependent epimerase [Agaricicola taiwanensis]